MLRFSKRLMSVLLCAVFLFTTASVAFAAEDGRKVVDSGFCGAQGENLKWTLYEDGELIISGEGEMDWYYPWSDNKKAPWNSYFEDIYIITVEEGVTGIGNYAFVSDYLTEYCKIKLPRTLQFVEGSFFHSIEMSRVPGQHLVYCYAGRREDWANVRQKMCNIKIDHSVPGTQCTIEYTGEQSLSSPESKYSKLYFNGEEPDAFCELIKDKELGLDYVAHYYSPDIRAEKILWYRIHNGKDKIIAQMNVGEYDVKEFFATTYQSGQYYLRADVVDLKGNVLASSEQVLIADVPEFGERVKLMFSDIKLLIGEFIYVLWILVGLPIFGAFALPIIELLDLFGYKF